MAVAQTSPRVIGLVSCLLVAFNALMLGLAIGSTPITDLPTPDHLFQNLAIHNAVFVGLFVIGHYALRKRNISTRAAYAAVGGIAAALAYAFALDRGLLLNPPHEGTRLTAGILPAIIGMMAGAMYVHFAGFESVDFKLPDLQTETRDEPASGADASPASFDGPIQVRTSLVAMVSASTAPALGITILMVIHLGMVSLMETATAPTRTGWSMESTGAIFSGFLLIVSLIVTVVPGSIGVLIVHGIARAMKRTDYLAYGVAGAIVGLVATMILTIMMPVPLFGALLAVCGPIMGILYRRIAGIEPLALPEVILATDRRILVGADDRARRTHAVILNG